VCREERWCRGSADRDVRQESVVCRMVLQLIVVTKIMHA
jgi:hypothetical protein